MIGKLVVNPTVKLLRQIEIRNLKDVELNRLVDTGGANLDVIITQPNYTNNDFYHMVGLF